MGLRCSSDKMRGKILRRIFCCVLFIMVFLVGKTYAESALLFSESFENFQAQTDGKAYPQGMYAQNFEGTDGGAGIYSANDIYGKCAIIKTTSNRGYTQLAYRYKQPAAGAVCFEVDLKIDDKNVNRLIQTRYGSGTETSVNVITISKTGFVYLGEKLIDGLYMQCSKWHHIKLTVNQSDGIVMAEIKSQDGDKYECIADIEKHPRVYSVWVTNSGKNDAITYVDNWKIRECENNPKMIYHRLNSFETTDDVETDGRLARLKGNNTLFLCGGEYAATEESGDGAVLTYAADVYFISPVKADVSIGGDTAIKITEDGELLVNGEKKGKLLPMRWYKIYITADMKNNIRYITVSADTRLVAEHKDTLAAHGKFKISVTSGEMYVDNMGIAESGVNVEPVLINIGVRFAEFVYPFFIDKETVEVYVDGKLCDAVLPGTRTVRVNDINENSKMHIANARDLYGNYIDTEFDFSGGDMFNIEFSQSVLQGGSLSVTVGTK